mgnify:CR=1 FL=1
MFPGLAVRLAPSDAAERNALRTHLEGKLRRLLGQHLIVIRLEAGSIVLVCEVYATSDEAWELVDAIDALGEALEGCLQVVADAGCGAADAFHRESRECRTAPPGAGAPTCTASSSRRG